MTFPFYNINVKYMKSQCFHCILPSQHPSTSPPALIQILWSSFTNCKPSIVGCIILLLHCSSSCSSYILCLHQRYMFFLLWRHTCWPQISCNITKRHLYPWPRIRSCYWLCHYECWGWHPLPLHPLNGWLPLPLPLQHVVVDHLT